MGLFDKQKEPIFLKDDSDAQKQLGNLKELRGRASGETAEKIDIAINNLEAGIYGEETIHYELANSHIPMYVIHDLYIEHEGLSAQIDYMIITRKKTILVECKNLYGNIEIDNQGNFIRTLQVNGRTIKEGIYSPITQNERHLSVLKEKNRANANGLLGKLFFEKSFANAYETIVVLANPKTYLNAKYAKADVKKQVIRADQLINYIKNVNSTDAYELSDKELKECAEIELSKHTTNPVDYCDKFRKMVEQDEAKEISSVELEKKTLENESKEDMEVKCPKCGSPMILRTASKGANAGQSFYGCSKFPKCRGIVNL